MHDQLRLFLDQQLRDYRVLVDHSWKHGGAEVIQIRDGAGNTAFAKRHALRDRFLAELAAYRSWVPALRDSAPRLLAHDCDCQSILVTAVPGRPSHPSAQTPRVQFQAGRLLNQLHRAECAQEWPDFVPAKLQQLEQWLHAANGCLSLREAAVLRRLVSELDFVPRPDRVACHGDYSPRNWLITDAGALSVIDFEWAAADVWVNDLARLYYGPWQGRPDLQRAFLEGYGREIGSADVAILKACTAARTAFLIPWARAHGELDLETSARDQLHALTG